MTKNHVLGMVGLLLLFVGLPSQISHAVAVPEEPDLIPWLMWTGSTVGATSTAYHFFATVKNRGIDAAAPTKTRLRIDLRANRSWDYEALRNTGGLIPGGIEGETWAFAIHLPNSATPGAHLFQICADALENELELEEGNNCRRELF